MQLTARVRVMGMGQVLELDWAETVRRARIQRASGFGSCQRCPLLSGRYMYVGDFWQSAPDQIKGHDFTIWGTLEFADDGNVSTTGLQDSFTIDIFKN
jgi:hypothetical protein